MRHLIGSLCLCYLATRATAHVSEQGFVLLLPTDVYISAGVVTVIATLALMSVLPKGACHVLFKPRQTCKILRHNLHHITSCLMAVMLAGLVWVGFFGSHDPMANPLPLAVWTIWWVGLVALQGLVGNHWRWTNPWTGPAVLLARVTGLCAPFRYPRWLGFAPAIIGLLGFAGFLLADPAPSDPTRLARLVGLYWYATFLGLVLFGPGWMVRAEPLTLLMRSYSRMALIGRRGSNLAIGFPGWQAFGSGPAPLGLAVFILILLGTGSFDGLNETFWWFGLTGLNPLEFPGRSAVIGQTILGLIAANAALILGFAFCLGLGGKIAKTRQSLRHIFCLFAPSVLPIALGYHLAHYLTTFMVDIQYALKAASDPMAQGADILGLGQFYVTTGFFNTPHTVRAIWLTQACMVVAGHVIAILLAHAIAVRAYGGTRRAVMSQVPLAVFMVLYTLFGLWLLASPRGL